MKYSKFFKSNRFRYLLLFLLFPLLAQDLLIELPVLIQQSRADNLKGTTEGEIEAVIPDRTMLQTVDGNKVVLVGYKVKYSYKIGNKTFFAEAYINNGTTQHSNIQRVLYDQQKTVNVKYNPLKPEISTIETSYKDIFLSM